MSDRLVQDCILVLRRIYDKQLSVNQIIPETGLNKKYVFETLNVLKRAKIIEKKKTKKKAIAYCFLKNFYSVAKKTFSLFRIIEMHINFSQD